jgi:hypothetical protein
MSFKDLSNAIKNSNSESVANKETKTSATKPADNNNPKK